MPDASWTRPETWHITLHFLGEVTRRQAETFEAEIAPVVEAAPGGDLETSGAVVFPADGAARVLAAGFADGDAAVSLASIAAAAGRLGARTLGLRSAGQDRFHPHVTLARLRRPWPCQAVERFKDELSGWRPAAWRVASCVLFQSRLKPGGAVHTPIRTFKLAASAVEALR
jgi:2'-5' RNA ligase